MLSVYSKDATESRKIYNKEALSKKEFICVSFQPNEAPIIVVIGCWRSNEVAPIRRHSAENFWFSSCIPSTIVLNKSGNDPFAIAEIASCFVMIPLMAAC